MQSSYDENSWQERLFAGFWVRFAAFLIDSVVVFAGLLVVRIFLMAGTWIVGGKFLNAEILFRFTVKDILFYLFQSMYFILLTYYTGTTLGKRALNLLVVSSDENARPSLTDIIYRETVGRFLSGLFLCAGYIMAGVDKEKCALHDFLCDTRVIYAKKVKVIPVFRHPVPPQMMPPMPPASPNPNAEPECFYNNTNNR